MEQNETMNISSSSAISRGIILLSLVHKFVISGAFINDFYRKHSFALSKQKNKYYHEEQIFGRKLIEIYSCSSENEVKSQSLSQSPILRGKHKFLGGAVDANGNVYGIPSHSGEIVCLSPVISERTNETRYILKTIKLPSSISKGKFKWLRGIICNDILFGIPAWSDSVLRVDLKRYWELRDKKGSSLDEFDESIYDDVVSVIPVHYEWNNHEEQRNAGNNQKINQERRWQWHGAALNSNHTAIYCIPSNARNVLKIDINTCRTELLPIPSSNTPLSQTNKWYGGILGHDECVYGIPYAASGILRINTNTDAVEIIGDFGVKQYHWHGGVISPKNGAIYAFPSHHSCVLKINTDPESKSDKLSLFPIERASHDTETRYKWGGGGVGADGNVYGMPSDACSILKIDTETDHVSSFGFVGEEKNKWQGAQLANDKVLYAIPSNAEQILCIDTSRASTDYYMMGNNFTSLKDKWQGGFVGKDGSIVCIPENFDRVLLVRPAGNETSMEFL